MSVTVKIIEGQRLKVGDAWKTAGDVVTINDDYQARVLIASGVAELAKK